MIKRVVSVTCLDVRQGNTSTWALKNDNKVHSEWLLLWTSTVQDLLEFFLWKVVWEKSKAYSHDRFGKDCSRYCGKNPNQVKSWINTEAIQYIRLLIGKNEWSPSLCYHCARRDFLNKPAIFTWRWIYLLYCTDCQDAALWWSSVICIKKKNKKKRAVSATRMWNSKKASLLWSRSPFCVPIPSLNIFYFLMSQSVLILCLNLSK